jgi:O-acetyl-ADP-ribose deacetylase (regulator of RNase III)
MLLDVISGDIAQMPADALITAINGQGWWFGGVDGAIQRVAGDFFHRQVQLPVRDGDVVYASLSREVACPFRNVIFVVDNLKQPLQNIVLAGLREAEAQQLAEITLPVMRTGVMAGARETKDEALQALADAIMQFKAEKPTAVKRLLVVVYNDDATYTELRNMLAAVC